MTEAWGWWSGDGFTSVMDSPEEGFQEILVEFTTEEKGYTVNVNCVLVCYAILQKQICSRLC